MELSCTNCQKKIHIPDEKIPDGKAFSLRCPACKTKIAIDLNSNEKQPPPIDSGWQKGGGFGSGDEEYDATEKPFDFLEEEGITAMVCEDDPAAVKRIKEVLTVMEYHVTVADDVRDALRKMKYHVYDLVLVNETFDGSDPDSNGILIFLERLNMAVRRHIYVGMLTKRYATKDNMAAFLKSVNVTINSRDVNSIDRILSRGINENELFYTVYKESMKRAGRI